MASGSGGSGLRRKPSRVLKATATVDRIERPRPEDWTGEWRIEAHDPWRGDDSREFSPSLPGGPRGKVERRSLAAPSRPARTRSLLEVRLRFAAGVLLVLFIAAAAASGAAQLWGRLTAEVPVQRWREVALRVSSIPSGAEVFIEGERRGKTPLTLREYCRARVVRVRVTTAGYANWTWHGVCPKEGRLDLSAHLQALER